MPDPSIQFYNAAVDAIQAGRLEEALASAESSLIENSKDAETWQLYVIILNALGRAEDAQKALCNLRELGLEKADDFLIQAAKAASDGDLSAAVANYESALETGSDRPEIYAGYALTLMQFERSEDALAAARIAVSLAPDDARANYALGHILRILNEDDEALSALTKAVIAEPDLMLAMYEQGMLLSERNRHEEALVNFTRFLKANPGDPSAVQAIESIHQKMRTETR